MIFLFTVSLTCLSQDDTTKKPVPVETILKDSPTLKDVARADSIRRIIRPSTAAVRSAIIPGWGQVYVRRDMKGSFIKKYWKLPIIYGALGITAGVFFYNLENYRDLRFAYAAKYKAGPPNYDSTDYANIKPELLPYDQGSLRIFRDEFRANIDLSVLVFLAFWGLNVADAAVDAHLKTFDVSPDLSFRFKLGPSRMAGTTGLSLVLGVKNKADYKPRLLPVH